MGRERRRQPLPRMSDIQMTSLMDLTFLLLIVFIITYPALEMGIAVKLPRSQAERVEQAKAQNITIDARGDLFFNNRRLTLGELEGRLSTLAAEDPQLSILVRGDEDVQYGQVVKVLRVLHRLRITRMALVTQPE